MKTNSSYGFILIGLAVRLLRHCDKTNIATYLITHIDMLSQQLENAGFQVSLKGLVDINRLYDELQEIEDQSKPVGAVIANRLTHEMELLERVIYAEAKTKSVYTLPERRFNSDSLLNNPQNIFKDGVFEKLSDMAKFDFKSGCRCILFGEATAAAFHILRATEDTLKHYYYHHKKQKRLKKPMWGPMTEELRNKRQKKPPEVILSSLDLVRVSYRNPTQHPNVKYDIDEAQDLFGVCVDLISKMAHEL